ncbi:MAG: DegT/DnrJ/EryC1/StrS family aminotransferase, partial [Elusimicrobia bacterium]|nr:DegT/DnrJ/EryC1/StrS family aminotransferase [Elusimicrobiota bacterium]
MKLALHGGKPIREKPFPLYNSIGEEERKAVLEVLDSGILSDFVGAKSPLFNGGSRVRRFEDGEGANLARKALAVNPVHTGAI